MKNYKHFRQNLLKYLESNPIIKYTEFKKKATSYYYKYDCNFKINTNTFKNIYYNWRRYNARFKKYSILINKTKNNRDYLKDYLYTYLYNKTGKTNYIHEHCIFASDYFIKKLRKSKHWYIDGITILLYNLIK